MIEMLFILTAIFVAYVIYVIVSEQKTTSSTEAPQVKAEKPVVAVKQPVTQSAPAEKAAEAKPAASVTEAPKPEAASEEPAVAQDAGKRGLKDPKTGEIAASYSNYRFTKRWIKEALVAEGLLDKVYKNDELNPDIEAKIKGAVIKLEAIDKYKV
jgi:hypothetical protein